MFFDNKKNISAKDKMAQTIEIKNTDDWNSLLDKAESGNSEAMNEVALLYKSGLTVDNIEIVKPDAESAFEWTRKSYEKGDIDGMIMYADYLSDGEYQYCRENIELAMQLYEKAMNAGSEIAAHSLGIEYRNKQNFSKAFELYLKANRSETFFPELSIGLCYYYGIGTEKDKLKALETFKSIHTEYNSAYEVDEANYLIGKIYLEGEVVERSIEKARHYLELADKDGDHRSAQELLIVIGRTTFIN